MQDVWGHLNGHCMVLRKENIFKDVKWLCKMILIQYLTLNTAAFFDDFE